MFGCRGIAVVTIALSFLLTTACGSSADSDDTPSGTTSAVPQEKPGPGEHRIEIEFGGKARSYVVHAPPSYNGATSLPLVVGLHFRPGDAAGVAMLSGLNAKADQENFLVVYPEGYSRAFNALICCGSEDDVGFIKTVVERMTTTWKADPKHVYAAGISNGGDMSFKLAVQLPGTFAAIAPVSGGFIGESAEQDAAYKPTTGVSVITFIGGRDRYFSRFDAGITRWQEKLACAPTGGSAEFPRGITLATATCADGSELHIYRLPEMGHSWPGAAQGELPDPQAGINATDLIWSFFAAHTK